MNAKTLLLTAAVLANLPAQAQSSDAPKKRDIAPGVYFTPNQTDHSRDAYQRDRPIALPADRLSMMRKCTELNGFSVNNNAEHKLGQITDVVVDLTSGQVVCAIVSPSGGSSAGPVLVPAREFNSLVKKSAQLRTEKSSLQDAPRLAGAISAQAMQDAGAYFGVPSVWNEASARRFSKCSALIGLPVSNNAREDLGKVVNVMVDIVGANLFYVVTSFDGTDKRLYALPPGAVALGQGNLILNADRNKIAGIAQPDSFFWTELIDPVWAANTYRLHGQDTGSGNAASAARDLSRENVRVAAPNNPVTPVVNKMAGRSDGDISREVMSAIVKDNLDNAFAVRHIKIISVAGQVTLSGKVKTQAQIDKFGAIAESVVGTGNVANQLEAKK